MNLNVGTFQQKLELPFLSKIKTENLFNKCLVSIKLFDLIYEINILVQNIFDLKDKEGCQLCK